VHRFTWLFKYMAIAGALLASSVSHAQVSCTREGLKAATDLYIAAQTKGDIADLPLAKGLGYVENFKVMNINVGSCKTPLKNFGHATFHGCSWPPGRGPTAQPAAIYAERKQGI